MPDPLPAISVLEKWYASQCNGEWEHGSGISLETIDNPGWHLRISLRDTKKQNAMLEWQKIERSETDWIHHRIDKKEFEVYCGAMNLSEVVGMFVRWFDS